MKKIIVTLLIAGMVAISSATIINIPADYPTIQQGIDASADGDTVLVQPGMYVENINFNGHNIVLGSLFLTTGDTSYISQTVVDGNSTGSVIRFEHGENRSAAVTGFTIQNGNNQQGGGGIYCYNNSNPTINHNYIRGNYSSAGGGVFCHHQCTPAISWNIITGNVAQVGGGIYFQSSNPELIGNIIINNQADMGGGVGCAGSNPTINRSIIVGNSANTSGGGLYCYVSSDPTFINCTISDNSAQSGGAAYHINSDATITNSILWANSAPNTAGIYSDNSTFVITFSNIQGGWEGTGNINIPPLFRDPGELDYHLAAIVCGDSADSPCIDAGWPAIVDSLLDCDWGLGESRSDMGAYGGGDSRQLGIINIPADYPTIQQGIDASADGDTVLVQPGIYIENLNFNNHNIVLGSLFLLTGDSSYITSTFIDGDSLGPVIVLENSEDGSTIITGFTIKNGIGLGSPHWYGGGIVCHNNSSPVIDYNYIMDNSSIYGGGGIDGKQSNPLIKHNVIINNSGSYGGGIGLVDYQGGIIDSNIINYNSASSGGGISTNADDLVISNNTIIDNSASSFGGGLWVGGNLTIVNNTILGNSADRGGGVEVGGDSVLLSDNIIRDNIATGWHGGGVYAFCTNLTITRNIICDNSSSHDGGGIYNYNLDPLISYNLIARNHARNGAGIGLDLETFATIINNTITDNDAEQSGGGLYCGFSQTRALSINTIFWGDSAGGIPGEVYSLGVYSPIIRYCDIMGGYPGPGNLNSDPMFIDPDNDIFHLLAGSPCIDAGDPNSPPDPDGTRADMGAFYFNQTVDVNETISPIPQKMILFQNFPNPYNASTAIRFVLSEPQNVKLTIYDLLGRRIEALLDEYREAGIHTVTFDASALSSGVYFYRLQAGEIIETKRMVLLK